MAFAAMAAPALAGAGAAAGISTAPLIAMTIASGGLSALQALGQSKYEAKMYELRAGAEGVSARQARNEAREKAVAIRHEANSTMGNIIAFQGATGQYGSHSGAARRSDAESTYKLNRFLARTTGEIEAKGHEARQSLYEGAASYTRRQGKMAALGTLLETAVSAYGLSQLGPSKLPVREYKAPTGQLGNFQFNRDLGVFTPMGAV